MHRQEATRDEGADYHGNEDPPEPCIHGPPPIRIDYTCPYFYEAAALVNTTVADQEPDGYAPAKLWAG
jgi:hypothetical protein